MRTTKKDKTMDKEEWIIEMQEAKQNNEYEKVKELCGKVIDISGHEPCSNFCPFVSICDWIEKLMGCLPDGTAA